MSKKEVIDLLKTHLDGVKFDSDWYYKKWKEMEKKIILLQESIIELEEINNND